jgi:hypothetical protein
METPENIPTRTPQVVQPSNEQITIESLMPLAKAWLENQARKVEAEVEAQSNRKELSKEEMQIGERKFNKLLALIAFVVVSVVVLGFVLVLRGDKEEGLRVFGYIVVIALSLLSAPTVSKLFKKKDGES